MRCQDDDEDGPHPPPMTLRPATALAITRCTLWSLFACWAVLMAAAHGWSMRAQTSAVQEAAVAGNSCAWLIAGYVVIRAVDKAIMAWIE